MHVERLVGGDRPGGRRPDHRKPGLRVAEEVVAARTVQPEGARDFLPVRKREADVDRRILAVLVFDLGLGERRAAVETPIHRLQPAVQIAGREQAPESADLVGLVAVGHRQIRILPVAEHPQPLEVSLLAHDLLGGVGAGQALRLLGGKVPTVLLFDLHFDRHAMTIPARHIGRIEARQGARLNDHVLEDLIDRVADVDVAVGVRRTVVQHEARPALARGAQAPVEPGLLPRLDPPGLALREVAAHRERRIEEVQRVLVVGHGRI